MVLSLYDILTVPEARQRFVRVSLRAENPGGDKKSRRLETESAHLAQNVHWRVVYIRLLKEERDMNGLGCNSSLGKRTEALSNCSHCTSSNNSDKLVA